MMMKRIEIKLSSKLYKDLEELTHAYTGGNVSEYLRMLIARESAQFKCPRLFLAGNGAALEVADKSGVKPLNWLLSAGTYYQGGVFRDSEDFKLARGLGGLLFLDSGAQQFYAGFNGFDYPYTEKDYLEFAVRVSADLIATLDLPLDILHPRGLPISDGVRRTVEHGVELIALAEDMGILGKVVPVLQGFDDPSQWLESLDLYKSHGVTPGRFKYWGVGSICMMKSPPLVHRVLSAIREAMPNVRLHVFGISMNSLKRVYHLIDSYDTSVWVYHAKVNGRVLIWDPIKKSFMRFKADTRYDTRRLMHANMLEILKMHQDLCTSLVIKRNNSDDF
jgi:hypothetical protein